LFVLKLCAISGLFVQFHKFLLSIFIVLSSVRTVSVSFVYLHCFQFYSYSLTSVFSTFDLLFIT